MTTLVSSSTPRVCLGLSPLSVTRCQGCVHGRLNVVPRSREEEAETPKGPPRRDRLEGGHGVGGVGAARGDGALTSQTHSCSSDHTGTLVCLFGLTELTFSPSARPLNWKECKGRE